MKNIKKQSLMKSNSIIGNSKIVTSNQRGLHEKLDETITKHINSKYKKPYQEHNLIAFDEILKCLSVKKYESLILDSCCGTGMSTDILAKENKSALVIGIDQSFKRLNKQHETERPENCLLLQANCEDIWRLCIEHDIHFDSHYILYPNPWPKSHHFKRRWHGHPVFPYLGEVAAKTILRSNWLLYIQEFQHAWFLLSKQKSIVQLLSIETPLTLFEKKYYASGQSLYELVLNSDINE